jgi:dTDP-4-amino-4,6-dideoxygalactose transaminase
MSQKINVPLLDLHAQYRTIKPEIEKVVSEVLASQQFILGPKVTECEAAIAKYSNVAHGIGASSGTDTLLMCLMAENIGPGDEVITTPYTFFATAGSISRVGAKPVFVDINPATYNINVAAIEAAVTPRTRAIMPVHLYGQMADMDPIMAVAQKHKLIVIEDAAQAIGAEDKGRRAGSIGHYGSFSFFPSKNLGAAGDGGMVVTNDAARAEKLKIVRAHGSKPKYYHKIVGGNFRLDSLQAAIVTVKLTHLDFWTKARQTNAQRYDRLFAESGLKIADSGVSPRPVLLTQGSASGSWVHLITPKVFSSRHIFNQYVIRVAPRDALKTYLDSRGIGTEIYYPVPMHLQECFANLGNRKGAFPESEAAANETLALPIYPEVSDEQARYVVECVRDFFLAAR